MTSSIVKEIMDNLKDPREKKAFAVLSDFKIRCEIIDGFDYLNDFNSRTEVKVDRESE
jgi:hypothetical protein